MPGGQHIQFRGSQIDAKGGDKKGAIEIVTGEKAQEELQTIRAKHLAAQKAGFGNDYLRGMVNLAHRHIMDSLRRSEDE